MFLILFAVANVSFGQTNPSSKAIACPVIKGIKIACSANSKVVIKFKVTPPNVFVGMTYQIRNSSGSTAGLPSGTFTATSPTSFILNRCNGMIAGQSYTLLVKDVGGNILSMATFVYSPPRLCACVPIGDPIDSSPIIGREK